MDFLTRLKRIQKYKTKFKMKHIWNFITRVITKDKFYICEECHHIHKRDGKEIRLDIKEGNGYEVYLLCQPIWYGSIGSQCYIKQQKKAKKLLGIN